LPALDLPSQEQVDWALGRAFRRGQDADDEHPAPAVAEPALQSYLLHRLLVFVGRVGMPLQVHVDSVATTERLGQLAEQYPHVRFVGFYGGYGDSFTLLSLARRLPNLALALGALWGTAPRLAHATLTDWILGVPSSKLFAFSGNTTMVEAVMVYAKIAREQIAAVLAEMVADGSLDEQDAALVIKRIMFENAQSYFSVA
jgi:hypothetical protein